MRPNLGGRRGPAAVSSGPHRRLANCLDAPESAVDLQEVLARDEIGGRNGFTFTRDRQHLCDAGARETRFSDAISNFGGRISF